MVQIIGLAVKAGLKRVMRAIQQSHKVWLSGAIIVGMMSLPLTVNGGPPSPPNMDALIAQTVFVKTTDGFGTGIVVGPNSVFTAKHVVEDSVVLGIGDLNGIKYEVVSVAPNSQVDLALITVKTELPMIATIACTIEQAEPVFIIGHQYLQGKQEAEPILASWVVRYAIVSTVGEEGYVGLDGRSARGMSGGPVFNIKGELIGMLVASLSGIDQDDAGLLVVLSSELLGLCYDS